MVGRVTEGNGDCYRSARLLQRVNREPSDTADVCSLA